MPKGRLRYSLDWRTVDVDREALGDKLADVAVDYRVGLAAARRPDNHAGSKNIDYVGKSIMPPPVIIKSCREIHRILVLDQTGFLHETLVLHVEDVLHEVVLMEPAHPQTRHQQAKITRGKRADIQYGAHRVWQRQLKQPPVQKKQHASSHQGRIDLVPGDFFPFDPMRAQTGDGQQKHRQQLGPEDTVENTGRVVEVYQNPVYHLKVQMPCGDTWIAVHINVYHQKKNTHGPAELHYLGESPQIVFLLHKNCG